MTCGWENCREICGGYINDLLSLMKFSKVCRTGTTFPKNDAIWKNSQWSKENLVDLVKRFLKSLRARFGWNTAEYGPNGSIWAILRTPSVIARSHPNHVSAPLPQQDSIYILLQVTTKTIMNVGIEEITQEPLGILSTNRFKTAGINDRWNWWYFAEIFFYRN